MAPSKNEEREAREARQRLRAYKARQSVHEHRAKRRVRDNWIAGILVVVIAAAATVGQLYFFSNGPGAPEVKPTPTQKVYTLPDKGLAENRDWKGTLTLNEEVELGITLNGALAPQGVSNFIYLTQQGFYKGTPCHRLTTSGLFVLQCGDPQGTGAGGPGYTWGPIENAPADGVYKAGTIAMARGSAPDSMGSQFFIVYEDTKLPTDSGGYTILGTVTSGLDQFKAKIADAGTSAANGDGAPNVPTTITGVTVK